MNDITVPQTDRPVSPRAVLSLPGRRQPIIIHQTDAALLMPRFISCAARPTLRGGRSNKERLGRLVCVRGI